MRTQVKILACVVIFVTLVALLTVAMMSLPDKPPMDGWITRKTSHPAYYPTYPDTPTVYCLGITAHNGNEAVSWKVSKEVYDSYSIGDLTGMPSNVKGAAK